MLYERSLEIERRLETVVRLIRTGHYSTPKLAERLGVSIPTVSRYVTALRERGYEIKALREARGWRVHPRQQACPPPKAACASLCPPGCKLVGIRVRSDGYGPRLFRNGSMPVLRGTFLQTSHRSGFLYAAGFKPRLGTYDGWETPVPLRIDIQHGEAPIELVATDILGLTKLNYNACKLGDSQPVTVGFSDAVGEILISNPTVTDRRPNFKFYI